MSHLNILHKKHTMMGNTELSWDLIERCGKGEPEALEVFFQIYSPEIYNFPIKVFHLDEDAASEFFLYAYKHLSKGKRFRSYQRRARFRTWFYAVLRNLVIDWMRTLREIEIVDVNSSKKIIKTTPLILSQQRQTLTLYQKIMKR